VNRRLAFGLSVLIGVAAAGALVATDLLLYPATTASQWPCGPGPPPDPIPLGPGPYEMGTTGTPSAGGPNEYNFTVFGGWCSAAWASVSFAIQQGFGGPNISTSQPGWNLTIHFNGTVVAAYNLQTSPPTWTIGASQSIRGNEGISLIAPSGVALGGEVFSAVINLGPYGGSVSDGIP
jgi:hypothetical protein